MNLTERYKELTPLKTSHQSEVLKGVDRITNQRVIVKSHRYHGIGYTIEREILQEVSHEHLSILLDVVRQEEGEFIVLKEVEGETLETLLESRKFSEYDVVEMLRQLCACVSYLHAHPKEIIHRDINPRNIMINARGHLVLIDFGISTWRQRADVDNEVCGTIGYAPPEVILSTDANEKQRDLYGIGGTLKRCLEKNPQIYSMELTLIWKKAMAIHPKDRYQSIEQMKEDLQLLC